MAAAITAEIMYKISAFDEDPITTRYESSNARENENNNYSFRKHNNKHR